MIERSQNHHCANRALPKYVDLGSKVEDLRQVSENTKIVLGAGGMRQSGSTWLYRTLKLVMEVGAGRTCARCTEDLQVGEAASANVVVLKTHQL